MSDLPILRVPKNSVVLPDKGSWTNRFEIHSASSNRVYIIAQHRTKRHWGCSCPGWILHRKCKHLTVLELPALEKPFEVRLLQEKGKRKMLGSGKGVG